MSLFELLSVAKKVYELYGFFNNMLTDKMAQIVENIGRKELNSAIKTLTDSRKSNNKEREIESTITQLRLALEKITDELVKAKIAALIAFCYSVLNEVQLARCYEHDSIKYFDSFIDGKMIEIQTNSNMADGFRFALTLPLAFVRNNAIAMLIAEYNGLLRVSGDLGLNIGEKEISFFSDIVSSYLSLNTKNIREKAMNVAQKIKQQYASCLMGALPIN